jgi:hypothetical protein
MDNPKQVYEARNLPEAELIKSLLQSEGIAGTVQTGPLEAAFGELTGNAETLPSVWVNDPDFNKATQIIEEFKQRPPAQASSKWTCPTCGEVLEGQFSSCWKCNTQRTEIA